MGDFIEEERKHVSVTKQLKIVQLNFRIIAKST